jgi:hypothetical protein
LLLLCYCCCAEALLAQPIAAKQPTLHQEMIHERLARDGKLKRLPHALHQNVVDLVVATSGRSRFELGEANTTGALMVRALERTDLNRFKRHMSQECAKCLLLYNVSGLRVKK